MEIDSQFVDNYVAAVQEEQPTDEHDAWVDQRLAQDFMQNAQASLRANLLVIALIFVLFFSHVNMLALSVWAVVCTFITSYRFYTANAFQRLIAAAAQAATVPNTAEFFRRHNWCWPASAAAFAFPLFLFHDQAPPIYQYLGYLILVGVGAVGATLMAARLTSQRQFAHALCGTSAAALLFHASQQWPTLPSRNWSVLLILVGVFWVLLLYIGKHLHTLQRRSYSVQFGNEQLIRSLRQQTQAATEAVQMKNNLLASAAHDLRQPVHALAFYADWLRNEPALAASVIPKILAATDSVNTLFNSLFDFARIESGAIKINMEAVDVEALINEMAVQFAPAADAKRLSLETQPAKVKVHSDAIQLRRITANLVANAIRYTDQGGVMIAARVVGDKLWLEISDSGSGIASEHLPHVFKEFYRAPSHEGTADSFGLGLAIVQRLCRALGHTVSIRSVVGKGTRCRLELSLASVAVFNSGRASEPNAPLASDF